VTNHQPASGPNVFDAPDRIRRVLSSRAPVTLAAKSPLVRASVLLPLFSDEPGGSSKVWLVRRGDALRTHQGQVALPGGKWDASDHDSVHTALREAYEEIGLPPGDVQILGTLDDQETLTGFVVTPHVGWIAHPFRPEPHALEVARVFSALLATFRREGVSRTVALPDGRERVVPCFEVEGEVIWGATASILRSFVGILGEPAA
jgi:8-oxo-dGTP pyrophosphatase MutT (NUDIX family)